MGDKISKVQQDDGVIVSCGFKEKTLSSFEANYIKVIVFRLCQKPIYDISIRIVFSDYKGIKIYHNTPIQELLLDFPKKNSYLELYDYEQELVFKLIRVAKHHERKELIF